MSFSISPRRARTAVDVARTRSDGLKRTVDTLSETHEKSWEVLHNTFMEDVSSSMDSFTPEQQPVMETIADLLNEVDDVSKRLISVVKDQQVESDKVLGILDGLVKWQNGQETEKSKEKQMLILGEVAFLFEQWIWKTCLGRQPYRKLTFAQILSAIESDGNPDFLKEKERVIIEQVMSELQTAGIPDTDLANLLEHLKNERKGYGHPDEAKKVSRSTLLDIAKAELKKSEHLESASALINFMARKFGDSHPLAMNVCSCFECRS